MRDDAEGQLVWIGVRWDYRMRHATDVVEGSLRMFAIAAPHPIPCNLDVEIKKFLPSYTCHDYRSIH